MSEVERRLAAGLLACPGCEGRLGSVEVCPAASVARGRRAGVAVSAAVDTVRGLRGHSRVVGRSTPWSGARMSRGDRCGAGCAGAARRRRCCGRGSPACWSRWIRIRCCRVRPDRAGGRGHRDRGRGSAPGGAALKRRNPGAPQRRSCVCCAPNLGGRPPSAPRPRSDGGQRGREQGRRRRRRRGWGVGSRWRNSTLIVRRRRRPFS